MWKKTIVAIALALPIQAHAAFWEFTFSGTAFLPTGERGWQTVSYVWDPDEIVLAADHRNDAGHTIGCYLGTCKPFRVLAQGPLRSATWRGLVNGSGDGVAFSGDDFSPDLFRGMGGSWSNHVGPTWRQLMDPELWFGEHTSQWTRGISGFDIHGGETGWTWDDPFRNPNIVGPLSTLTISVRPFSSGVPEPGTLALLGLALAMMMRRKT